MVGSDLQHYGVGTYVGATVHCTVECRCKRVQNLGFSGDGSWSDVWDPDTYPNFDPVPKPDLNLVGALTIKKWR